MGTSYVIQRFCKLGRATRCPRRLVVAGDFGQARMAALGWLVSLADRAQPSEVDAVVARFRLLADKVAERFAALAGTCSISA